MWSSSCSVQLGVLSMVQYKPQTTLRNRNSLFTIVYAVLYFCVVLNFKTMENYNILDLDLNQSANVVYYPYYVTLQYKGLKKWCKIEFMNSLSDIEIVGK